jgi:transposase
MPRIVEACRYRFVGEIPSRPEAIGKMVDRLAANHGRLSYCYEAGPCGYGPDHEAWVRVRGGWAFARSTLPGDHVKTDRRDAVTMASLYR